MAYKKVVDANAETAIALGGKDKNGKNNPTSIEGHYLGFKEVESDYGKSKLHIFSTEKGNTGVWGKTNLDRLLTPARVGQMCLVSFTGMGKAQKGRRPPYNFEVQYDDDNTIETGNINLETQGQEPEYSSVTDEEDVDMASDDSDPEYDEKPVDEVVPQRASRPALTRPSAAAVAKTQGLLGGRNKIS